ncbi:MAG TPA: C45 family peptidase [Dokdonella sp.]|uniref:C45 family peptidase n=1 Tax=Dokdonella sp. TaxID=2291710 RepID=UPI002D7F4029|nr:C45 family peptidase [Dokdonella sp.]HET9032025.1 C45 family peptidase [Dokdonella sp.]
MYLTFNAIADDPGSSIWQGLFQRLWPAYRRWYLRDGHLARPTYLDCRRALEVHMPEFVPRWRRLVELAGDGDVAARFLSLWCPPAYDSACSQAVWPGEEPLLVRNYDYSAKYFDAVCLHTHWGPQQVIGTSDCLVGLVDGINESGLALSLTFGGRNVVGVGFGVPIVLRYVLETCTTAEQAATTLARIPVHMAYNVTALDRAGHRTTVFLAPDRAALVTNSPVATNHQPGDAGSIDAYQTATIERERFLLGRLMLHEDPAERFIGAFLRPPLFSLAYERQRGTLYTAALWPRQHKLSYRWPHAEWTLSLDSFEPGSRRIVHPAAESVAV